MNGEIKEDSCCPPNQGIHCLTHYEGKLGILLSQGSRPFHPLANVEATVTLASTCLALSLIQKVPKI